MRSLGLLKATPSSCSVAVIPLALLPLPGDPSASGERPAYAVGLSEPLQDRASTDRRG